MIMKFAFFKLCNEVMFRSNMFLLYIFKEQSLPEVTFSTQNAICMRAFTWLWIYEHNIWRYFLFRAQLQEDSVERSTLSR